MQIITIKCDGCDVVANPVTQGTFVRIQRIEVEPGFKIGGLDLCPKCYERLCLTADPRKWSRTTQTRVQNCA